MRNLMHSLIILVFSVPAMAQTPQTQVIFEETFADGADLFTLEGNAFASNGGLDLRGDYDSYPGPGRATSIPIDVSNFSNMSLSFDRTTRGLDAGETGEVLVSVNGGTFTALESTQSATGRTTLAIGYRFEGASTLTVAFQINASNFFESYSIDNIVLEGDLREDPAPRMGVSGYFLEGGVSATTSDTLSFTNTGEANITRLGIFLDPVVDDVTAVVFDPDDVPFVVTGNDDVGFDGEFLLNNETTGNIPAYTYLFLRFSDFNPGETFSFHTDLDDANGGFTLGYELTESFITISDYLPGIPPRPETKVTFFADPGNTRRAVIDTDHGN